MEIIQRFNKCPTTTVDTTDSSYSVGTLVSNLEVVVTGQVSDVSNHDTKYISGELVQLYYTDATRSRASVSVTDSGGYGSLVYHTTHQQVS